MPERLFKAASARMAPGLNAIESLAESCGTSLTATGIRYAQLSDDPVTVVCSKGGRVQFAFMSQALKGTRGLTWIRKNMGLPAGTATAEFNKDETNVAETRRVTSSCTMDAWFDCGGTVRMVEEVVGLGSYGLTLTVLSGDPFFEVGEEESEENEAENILPSDRWRQSRRD